jgi:hypothetical protein
VLADLRAPQPQQRHHLAVEIQRPGVLEIVGGGGREQAGVALEQAGGHGGVVDHLRRQRGNLWSELVHSNQIIL